MARPPVPKDEARTKLLRVALTEAEMEALRAFAWRQRESISAVVRAQLRPVVSPPQNQ